jgi:hypothetical protein
MLLQLLRLRLLHQRLHRLKRRLLLLRLLQK